MKLVGKPHRHASPITQLHQSRKESRTKLHRPTPRASPPLILHKRVARMAQPPQRFRRLVPRARIERYERSDGFRRVAVSY